MGTYAHVHCTCAYCSSIMHSGAKAVHKPQNLKVVQIYDIVYTCTCVHVYMYVLHVCTYMYVYTMYTLLTSKILACSTSRLSSVPMLPHSAILLSCSSSHSSNAPAAPQNPSTSRSSGFVSVILRSTTTLSSLQRSAISASFSSTLLLLGSERLALRDSAERVMSSRVCSHWRRARPTSWLGGGGGGHRRRQAESHTSILHLLRGTTGVYDVLHIHVQRAQADVMHT